MNVTFCELCIEDQNTCKSRLFCTSNVRKYCLCWSQLIKKVENLLQTECHFLFKMSTSAVPIGVRCHFLEGQLLLMSTDSRPRFDKHILIRMRTWKRAWSLTFPLVASMLRIFSFIGWIMRWLCPLAKDCYSGQLDCQGEAEELTDRMDGWVDCRGNFGFPDWRKIIR